VVLDYILQEWLSFLAKKHIVKVIAAMPYYPQWKIYRIRQRRTLSTEIVNDGKSLGSNNFTPAIQHLKNFPNDSFFYQFLLMFLK
jgi:hypothetical protein